MGHDSDIGKIARKLRPLSHDNDDQFKVTKADQQYHLYSSELTLFVSPILIASSNDNDDITRTLDTRLLY